MSARDNPDLARQLTRLCGLVRDGCWAVIDVETSGSEMERGDRIIEAAVVTPSDEWSCLVNPGEEARALMDLPFPGEASERQLCVLRNEMVRRALSFEEAGYGASAGVPDSTIRGLVSAFRKNRLAVLGSDLPRSVARALIAIIRGEQPKAASATALCGIMSSELEHEVPFKGPGGAGEILDRSLRGKSAVMFGAEFDAGFLAMEYGRYQEVPEWLLEPLCLREVVDDLGWPLEAEGGYRHSLSELCEAAGLRSRRAHNALEDARSAADLLRAIHDRESTRWDG